MRRLSGRTAVVTGAGSGNGRAMALRFASEGARVVVADIRDDWGNETVAMIHRDGEAASYKHTDVTDSAAVDALVDHALTWGGRLDIMVNNAGINLRWHQPAQLAA